MASNRLNSTAEECALKGYGKAVTAHLLGSYEDLNFRLTDEEGGQFLLKIAAENSSPDLLIAQNKLLQHINLNHPQPEAFPKILADVRNNDIYRLEIDGKPRFARLLTFLPGTFLSEVAISEPLLASLGAFLANLWTTINPQDILAFRAQQSCWNLQYAYKCLDDTHKIQDPYYRRIAQYFLHQYEQEVTPRLSTLPHGIIHSDANDHNVLVMDQSITGLIDFGDACYSARIHEIAIALTYVMMKSDDPLSVAGIMTRAYHQVCPLEPAELELLYYMINARLAVSLTCSTISIQDNPDNHYLVIHQQPVRELMDQMIQMNPATFKKEVFSACEHDLLAPTSVAQQLENRYQHISPALSISYQQPLRIYKGAMQYLYEEDGRTLLDGVNNICHVGHSHPLVVQAARSQWNQLNTNTRYLYAQLNDYAARLCALLPDPLSVVFFVNSGSEANDLALRMARTHTQAQHMLVLEGAYHGNSSATIAVSPYKYNSKGGPGAHTLVHEVPMPDLYRGIHAQDSDPAASFVREVTDRIEHLQEQQQTLAGFISESIMSCGGQIVLPDKYLQQVYAAVRAAGGVCIADEVQVGFGRVGSHFWGFQTQGVIPDIVTMGKPMGNGHPLAAVVTTPEIAASFDTGMEYFNSFGGNPVSCAIGNAVLDILEKDNLLTHAQNLGTKIMEGFSKLQTNYPQIGDVRGLGLFLGLELVEPDTRNPNAQFASDLVESMKDKGVLLSTDGPQHNVIKFKPPMVFSEENAHIMLDKLQTTFSELT